MYSVRATHLTPLFLTRSGYMLVQHAFVRSLTKRLYRFVLSSGLFANVKICIALVGGGRIIFSYDKKIKVANC